MGLLSRLTRWQKRTRPAKPVKSSDVSSYAPLRRCRFEPMEPRCVLNADPLFIGGVYIEEDLGSDLHGDTFQITFEGGAPGTQLRRVVIDGDQNTPGFGVGDLFFDTLHSPRTATNNGYGADEAFPFTVVSRDGIDRVTATVVDGTSQLILEFEGFDAGETLIFSIDVDEVQQFDPEETDLDYINDGFDPITSGVEFQGSLFQAEFTAPHYRDISGEAQFRNRYDDNFAGTGLNLPADNEGGKRDRTAGAVIPLQQIPKPVTIAGTVYHDADLDLTQDSGENGLSGVTLGLWKKDGSSYVFTGHTTTTNAQGDYLFGASLDLLPGTYHVRETQPQGYFSIGATTGTVDGQPTGATVNNNRDILTGIDIPLGDLHAVNYDFAEAQPAYLSGYVYHDRDNDGRRDSGEEGISGAQIQIIAVDTIVPQTVVTLQTDENGFYQSPQLAPGTYRVVEVVQPAGYLDGLDAAGRVGNQVRGVAVNPGDAINGIFLGGNHRGVEYNFGELRPAEIHGRVHLTDPDGNCVFEGPGYRPLSGVEIKLYDASGALVAQTVTNAQGEYSFLGLRPGDYRVVETTPTGLIDGDDHIGTVDGSPRGALAGNDQIGSIVLASGELALGYDFCESEPASVAGYVYHDQNQNGRRDSSEQTLANVTVTLLDQNGNQVAQTQTNANGAYRFNNLTKGEYRIIETHPAGWIDGQDAAGTIAGTIVGQAVNPGDEIQGVALKWGDDGVEYNFGEYKPVSISGYVYHDRDNDGRRESGEEGIAGVRIRVVPVDTLSPQAARTVTTDANGFYEVTGLAPGTYRVIEVAQPDTFNDGLDTAGKVGGQTRGAAVNPGDQINGVLLNTGEHGVEYNFGEIRSAEIRGRVHLTTPDGDCVGDESSLRPIAGAVVRLLDANGVELAQTTTDANGEYRFGGLLPGTYSIVEETPAGLIDGDEHVGRIDGVEVGSILGNDRVGEIVITSGQSGVHYDFCESEPASVSGYVYHDQNQNGRRDASEEALPNVTVTLFDQNGNQVGQATTNAAGYYAFSNLVKGEYRLVESHPQGWIDGTDNPGTVDGVTIGQAVNPGDEIRGVALKWGDDGVEYNFGEYRPVSISGYVYHDRDNDGRRESGEEGLAGVRIRVVPVDTLSPQSARTVTTDANGFYEVAGLAPGTYRVVEVAQPDTFNDGLDTAGKVGGQTRGVAVNPGDQINGVLLNTGESGVEYNFGEIRPAEISGRVHLTTPDGDCEGPESELRPIVGAVVRLLDAQGNQLAQTLTDANGEYRFGNLLPGVYTVVEETPPGLIDGAEHVGTIDGVKVGQILGDDRLGQIALTSGQSGQHYDFCEHEPAAVSGYVYHDRNNNGARETSEQPIAGVSLTLFDAAGQAVAQTTTNDQGFYQFSDLRAGTYTIRETQPQGWLDGLDAPGQIGGVTVGSADNPGDVLTDVALKWGDQGQEYNFGELKPVSISGYVYHDRDNDGRREDGEEGISGVQIRVVPINPTVPQTPITVTTNEQGFYQVTGLPPGKYRLVEVAQPAGFEDGLDAAGTVNGRVSGQAVNPGDQINGVMLASGQTGVEYNFGEFTRGEISGRVTLTSPDGDCHREGEDVRPVAGAVIRLFDDQGNLLATTETDAQGRYRFTDLLPGRYTVVEETPTGLIDGDEHVGGVDGSEIGRLDGNDRVTDIVMTSGQSLVDYDFCEHEPATLAGHVYHDRDNDGRRDAGEEPIGNVTVVLRDAAGNEVARQRTNSSGAYRFTGLAARTYVVSEIQPGGWIDGRDTAGTVGGVRVGRADSSGDAIRQIALQWGDDGVEYNFGELKPALIEGIVHSDPDQDCEYDDGEQLLSGVRVRLLNANGVQVAETTTDANGRYRFEGLRPGSYTIVEEQPQDYFNGGQVPGTTGGDGSVENIISNVEIHSGDHSQENNFCEIPPAQLSGYVFQDGAPLVSLSGQVPDNLRELRDGLFTPDDTPLAGVVLELRNGINGEPIDASAALPGIYPSGPIRVTTDANGFYEFHGLRPGNYAVFQKHPDGFADSLDTPGTLSGLAFNLGETVPASVINALSVNPHNDAIVRIIVPAGANSQNNNFSEVRVISPVIPTIDPPPEPPTPLPAAPTAAPLIPPAPPLPPPVIAPPVDQGVHGGGDAFTWHLSVVNAGAPRGGSWLQPAGTWPGRPASFGQGAQWNTQALQFGMWEFEAQANERVTIHEQQTERGVFHRIFGLRGAKPISGDWNGDGVSELGVFYKGQWFLDLNGNGQWDSEDLWAVLGDAKDQPVVGDWDGDGKDDIGIFGPMWPGDPRAIRHEPGEPDAQNRVAAVPPYNNPKNVPPDPDRATDGQRTLQRTAEGRTREDLIDHVFQYGTSRDVPITGDWNGDGISTIGVFRDGVWVFDSDGDGLLTPADARARYGDAGDVPVVGDWNGDGVDDVGVFRNGRWTVDSDGNREMDAHDKVFDLGGEGDHPVAGDWDGDGVDEAAVYRDAPSPEE